MTTEYGGGSTFHQTIVGFKYLKNIKFIISSLLMTEDTQSLSSQYKNALILNTST